MENDTAVPTSAEIAEKLQQQYPEVFKALFWEIRSNKLEELLTKGFSMPDEPEGEEA